MASVAHCSVAPLKKERRRNRTLNSPEWRKKALRMDFRIRIGLGKHVAEREDEVVQVSMIVELALFVIKRGIRALRISVQNPAHPLPQYGRLLFFKCGTRMNQSARALEPPIHLATNRILRSGTGSIQLQYFRLNKQAICTFDQDTAVIIGT